jgi:hypothetical protein
VKQVKSLLHLLIGLALLATAAYFVGGLAKRGKAMWQQEMSGTTNPPPKPGSAVDDSVLSAANGQSEVTGGAAAAPAPTTGPPLLVDRKNHLKAIDGSAPNHFLQKRLSVKAFEFFAFEVPSHAIRPELEGTFQCLPQQHNSDVEPSVEILLMNAEEFDRFVKHRAVTTKLSSHPSTGGEIYWKLKPSGENPQKYYLVVRNSAKGQEPTVVDADFSANFQ